MSMFARLFAVRVAVVCVGIAGAVFSGFGGTIDVSPTDDLVAIVAAAESGTVIQLSADTFKPTATIEVPAGVTVKGMGRAETTIDGTGLSCRAFILKSADSRIESLTVTNYKHGNMPSMKYDDGGTVLKMSAGTLFDVAVVGNECTVGNVSGIGLFMSGGTVTNCLFKDNFSSAGNGWVHGGGVCATGGRIVDTVFDHNTRNRYQMSGGGLYLSSSSAGTLVRNCTFVNNGCNGYGGEGYNDVGGLYLEAGNVQKAAVVENCLIATNDCYGVHLNNHVTMRNCLIVGQCGSGGGRGIIMAGGSLYNNTIYGNKMNAEGSGLKMSNGTAVNNIIWGNGTKGSASVTGGTFNTNITDNVVARGVGNVAADPLMTDADRGDFTIGAKSPAWEAGATLADVTVDYVGTARPQGAALDIGALERPYVPGEVAAVILVGRPDGKAGDTTTVNCRLNGAQPGAEYVYKWFVNGVEVVGQTGPTLTLENLPADKYTFRVEVSGGGLSAAVTDTATDALMLKPYEVWVDEGGSSTFPYADKATAATDLSTALDSIWMAADSTAVVHVGEGTYELKKEMKFDYPCRILGAGRDKTVVSAAKITSRPLTMGAGSVIQDLTLCGATNGNVTGVCVYMTGGTIANANISRNTGTAGNSKGMGVYMTGGSLTNCVIADNFCSGSSGWVNGGGAWMSGGTIVDCIFDHNTRNRYQMSGGGLYVASASAGTLVRGCTFVRNGCNGQGNGTDAGGLYLSADNAQKAAVVERCVVASNDLYGVQLGNYVTMRNCLVFNQRNGANGTGRGVVMTGGSLYNNTIVGNTKDELGCGLSISGGTAVNNIIWGNGTKGSVSASGSTCVCATNLIDVAVDGRVNLVGDPCFTDAAGGDFSFSLKSPALDAGEPIASVIDDFFGTERPQGDAWDIGAVERVPRPEDMTVAVLIDQTDYPLGAAVTVRSRVIGGSSEVTRRWTVDGVVLEGETGESVVLENLALGRHTVRLDILGLSVPIFDEKVDAIAVKPSEVWVNENGGDVYPYASAETAAKGIDAAMDALWTASGTTAAVHVAAGTYPLTNALVFTFPVRLLGAGRTATVIDASTVKYGARTVTMGEGSVVCDLTLTGANNRNTDGGTLNMSGGLVDNVLMTGNRNEEGQCHGFVLKVTGGVVTNSVIADNDHTGSAGWVDGSVYVAAGGLVTDSEIRNNTRKRYQMMGGGVYLAGGTVRGCTIVGNGVPEEHAGVDVNSSSGGGIYFDGTLGGLAERCVVASNHVTGVWLSAGTLKNCLVYGQSIGFSGRPAGVWVKGGQSVNCTFADNTNTADRVGSDLNISSGDVKNSIATVAVGTAAPTSVNCFNEDPHFRNPENGDYHLTRRSTACINKGDPLDYTAASVDLDGNPRVFMYGSKSAAPDLGCYESAYGMPGFMLIVR